MAIRQSTDTVLMVSPVAFSASQDAQADNVFMDRSDTSSLAAEVLSEVQRDHQQWVELFRRKGVTVFLFSHPPESPDAVFPNNWFATTPQVPSLSLFPMKVPNRRLEARSDIVQFLRDRAPPSAPLIDLRRFVDQNLFLEGTGSIVVDWLNHIIFASLSLRTSLVVLQEWVAELSRQTGTAPFRIVSFRSESPVGIPVYHTNVIMAIGTRWVVACLEAIVEEDRARIAAELQTLPGKVLIPITIAQMGAFCGNILELAEKYVCMSSTAFNAFTNEEKAIFETQGKVEILHLPLGQLERVGGGGIRCCIAELF